LSHYNSWTSNDSIGDCEYLNYSLKWSKIGNEEYLSGPALTYGTFSGGNIKLKKKGNLSSTQYDFIKKNAAVNTQKTPAAASIVKPKVVVANTNKSKADNLHKNVAIQTGSVQKNNTVLQPVSQKEDISDVLDLKTRENKIEKTITVNSKQVELSIYDYGQIDHDIISVYVDKKPVLVKKELTKKPLIVNLEIDDNDNFHEVILVAENLGDIPPNTALMKIKAGNKKCEIKITSTEEKNAVVIFKYKE